MTFNKTFILIFIVFVSCNASKHHNVGNFDLFASCVEKRDTNKYVELNHQLFKIKYPDNWEQGHKLSTGLDISSNNFADTLQRGFMLSVVPYQEMYLKKNPIIEYYKYLNTKFNNFDAIFLTRNDLFPRESDNTVYWRSEIKIVNKAKTQVYILVMGKRHNKDAEPLWCDFKEIIESLKIIE